MKTEQASTKAALQEAEEERLRATEALKHAEAVKDFLNDGVLHNALLRESLYDSTLSPDSSDPDINEVASGRMIAAFSPAHINQGTFVSQAAPFLQTRSDTFRIRAYGQSTGLNTDDEHEAWLEAVVQRIPEPTDSTADVMDDADGFGRKFKVVSMRWIEKDDV